MTEPTQENQAPEILEVQDLNQFVQVLATWHAERCAMVRHMLEIPEGAEFQVGAEEGVQAKVVMTSESLPAFKLGIEMALMQLGTLPFVAETEDAKG